MRQTATSAPSHGWETSVTAGGAHAPRFAGHHGGTSCRSRKISPELWRTSRSFPRLFSCCSSRSSGTCLCGFMRSSTCFCGSLAFGIGDCCRSILWMLLQLIPFMRVLVFPLAGLIGLAWFFLWLLLVVKAYQHEMFKLPSSATWRKSGPRELDRGK